MSEVKRPSSHSRCLLCGEDNPLGLKLKFHADGDGGVKTELSGGLLLQGYQGILHGGVIAAVLDSAMTHCLFQQGLEAVTGDLRVRFREPVPCQAKLELKAWVKKSTSPLHLLAAELSCGGKRLAWAEAKFMERRAPQKTSGRSWGAEAGAPADGCG